MSPAPQARPAPLGEAQAAVPFISMRNISKSFGALKALSGVELDVHGGEVHSLMGENGAGKSTLMKILSGAYKAGPGSEIRVDGEPVAIDGPADAKAHGIAVIYQELALAPNLTVGENIYLGRELRTGWGIDRKGMQERSRSVLRDLGADFGPEAVVADLTLAQRQLVEIAKALHANARVIVMDEPTTALSTRETERLFGLIHKLRADGLAIVYISHRMSEIYALSDRCSVLRDGVSVGTLSRSELSADRLVRMMVGRDLSTFYKKEGHAGERGPVVLEVKGLGDGKAIRPCSFSLHKGEVLGIAGLVGSGRTELARLIYGSERPASGAMVLEGEPFAPRTPEHALGAGLAYLTEDRKGLGLFLDMSVLDNINISVSSRDARAFGVLNRRSARRRAMAAIKDLAIRVPGPNTMAGALSGGNQQKVLLSRLLQTEPRVLILDEPTRGVDIGAKAEIYRIIDELARSGVGIILISSELPEVVGTSDRVLVMREGELVGELGGATGREVTQETIIALATGASAGDARHGENHAS